MIDWIKNEWKDPSTHAWLVGLGAIMTAWSNGAMSNNQALVAAAASIVAIIIPTTAAKP